MGAAAVCLSLSSLGGEDPSPGLVSLNGLNAWQSLWTQSQQAAPMLGHLGQQEGVPGPGTWRQLGQLPLDSTEGAVWWEQGEFLLEFLLAEPD